MKQYNISRYTISQGLSLLFGILLIGFGVTFLFKKEVFITPLSFLFVGYSLYNLGLLLFKVDRINRHNQLISFFLYLGLAIVFYFRNELFLSTLGLFLILWAIINFLVKVLNIYFYYMINRKFSIFDIFIVILNFFVIITLLILEETWSGVFVLSLSGYLIYYGIELILLTFRDRYIRQPQLFQMLLPNILVKRVNKGKIKLSTFDETQRLGDYVNIYVYLGDRLQDKVGHVDIGYQGKIYTYGAHDPEGRNKFFLWGNGVLIVCDETEFINYSMSSQSKTIIKFVYQLTEDEKNSLENQIDKLFKQTILFNWPKESIELEHYAVDLVSKVGAETCDFYTFTEQSIFKTYNLFKINCVLVTYYLINSSNSKLFDIRGLLTPGAYYEALVYLYNQSDSPISSMTVLKTEDFTFKKLGVK